jgi:hypothetical protein
MIIAPLRLSGAEGNLIKDTRRHAPPHYDIGDRFTEVADERKERFHEHG